ncbi:DUF2968 domain-containing protein [Pseudoxanthomonas broegbernensis]|nr:DUF2968 domain-containing protein [Pseudoxanthomonas broegbernensis]
MADASAARPWKQPRTPEEATAAPPADQAAGSTVAELRELMDGGRLTELRTTYNGNYGASLLFYTQSLHYYVALFRDREFWRVIKTDSVDDAERYYRTFVAQTEDLAQVYIDTVRLDAGKRFTERMVALNEQRLRNLQQEVEMQRQQSLQVSTALQQARQQAVSLSSDLRASHSELDAINQRIEALQAVQANPELSLPGSSESVAPAIPSASVADHGASVPALASPPAP